MNSAFIAISENFFHQFGSIIADILQSGGTWSFSIIESRLLQYQAFFVTCPETLYGISTPQIFLNISMKTEYAILSFSLAKVTWSHSGICEPP